MPEAVPAIHVYGVPVRPFRYHKGMSGSACNSPSLYRVTLGDQYDRLPPVLRAFHDLSAGGRAQGDLCITRGVGRLRGLCADLMRLPRAADCVTVRLEVKAARGAERWVRDFGPHRLVTDQWHRNGLLVEAAGPMRFGFRLTASETQMAFTMERCWLLGLPVPVALAPRVSAVVTGRADAWWTVVTVDAPLLGLLARYEGEMAPLL